MFQFIHIEVYSEKTQVKDGKVTKRSVRDVVDEALRHAGDHPHVAEPKPPIFLHGTAAALDALPDVLKARREAARTSRGTAMRKDTATLLAGVSSYPRDGTRLDEWRDRTMAFLRAEYGGGLQAVLMHDDEAHPHIHFFVTSEKGVDVKPLHPGCAAERAAATPAERKRRYCDAMRAFQVRYWDDVGKHCGMTVHGPRRTRMTRAQWMTAQADAERLAQSHADIEKKVRAGVVRMLRDTPMQLTLPHVSRMQLMVDPDAWRAAILPALRPVVAAARHTRTAASAQADAEQRLEKEKAARKRVEKEMHEKLRDYRLLLHANDMYRAAEKEQLARIDTLERRVSYLEKALDTVMTMHPETKKTLGIVAELDLVR